MILYHGTKASAERIRKYGIMVFTPQTLISYLLESGFPPMESPAALVRLAKEALTTSLHGGYISFSRGPSLARGFAVSSSEMLVGFFDEWAWDALVEGPPGRVVVVEVPDKWMTHPDVIIEEDWGDPNDDEIHIPWTVGPEYIKEIIEIGEGEDE